MAKKFPASNGPDGRRNIGNRPAQTIKDASATRRKAAVVVPVIGPSNPNALGTPTGAIAPDRIYGGTGDFAQETPQARLAGDVLVDVDTGPGGLGMVFWFQGG